MDFLVNFITHLSSTITDVISAVGYPGVFFFMVLESMVFPIPSELIMPFAGFLIAKGEMSFVFVLLASVLGSLVGSLLSYAMGKFGGEPLIRRYGKYFFVDSEDLIKTEKWFQKKGEKTIFFSRLIPVVRHLISIPAGMAKMSLVRFCVYTLAGATLWNAFLTEAGVLLGVHWELMHDYLKPLSIATALLLLIFGTHFIVKHIKHKKTVNRL